MHRSYRMKPKHKLLSQLYDEWIGEGDFHDGYGGIEGRNKEFGSRWRKHLTAYVYSRTERTIKGIRAYAQCHNNMDPHEACRQLQEIFEKERCCISNMVSYFTSNGYLKKKQPRGKRKTSD
jgi:hypothetical protein